MSENKFDFTVESIISEIGVDKKYRRKSTSYNQEQETEIFDFASKDFVSKDFSPKTIKYQSDPQAEDEFEKYDNLYQKFKRHATSLDRRSKLIFMLFAISLYLFVATIYGFKLPDILVFIDFPYVFMLSNAILHIFALILAVDIVEDGLCNLSSPNINTLVVTTSFFILLHSLSMIFLKNSIAFFPLTQVAIFILYCCTKSFEYIKSSKSFVYRICCMTSKLAFVSIDSDKNRKFTKKTPTFTKTNFSLKVDKDPQNILMSIYFAFFLIFSISFSIFIAQGNLSLFFWNLAVISSISVPVNFILGWSLPYKYASKNLFDDGIAVKSYNDIKKIDKTNSIIMSDRDLFPENTVVIAGMKLCGHNTEHEIISYVASGFSMLNSCTKYAFEYQLKKLYLKPLECTQIDLIDQDGFTFTVLNQKISVGNAKFVNSLGITIQETFDIQNPIYVVISSRISAIISLKHYPSPKLFNLISNLEMNSFKIIVSTIDFTINEKLIARTYDLSEQSIIFDSFATRYHRLSENSKLDESILIARHDGFSYLKAIKISRSLVTSAKLNIILGFLCAFLGIFIVSYLLFHFSPTLLLSHNILGFLIFWSFPTLILSFIYNKL